ncbi:MAG: DUF5666 domain-containing protein, partial [Methylophilaceae bacterium]
MINLSIAAIANPCDGGGIGGTGIESNKSGIGGTGILFEKGGIGGTGINSAQQGIGGTGIVENQGIGGTGIVANQGIGGTGIVGIITGFGSICVNRLEVHYFSNTPVDLDGKQISSQALSIGQVVSIHASSHGESLVANEIHAYHQITGPISEVNVADGKLKIIGQSVITDNAQLKGLKVGQWVNVSGLRQTDGSIIASRIDKTTAQSTIHIVGFLTRQSGKVNLSGTNIEGLAESAVHPTEDTRISGVWDGKTLHVKQAKLGPVSDLLHKVDTFYIQGLASGDISSGHLRLSGQQIKVTGQTRITGSQAAEHLAGKAVVMHGQVKDGKPTVLSIEVQPIKTDHKIQHVPAPLKLDSSASQATAEKSTDHVNVEKLGRVNQIEQVERVEQ